MDEFLWYLREYFVGPTKQAEMREMFLCKGDPRSASVKSRGGVWVEGLGTYLSTFVRRLGDLKLWNIYMGVGFWLDVSTTEPYVENMLYDRVSFDFDSEDNPEEAIGAALQFSSTLTSRYSVDPIVFRSGFKGAHVVIPLSRPTDWDGYQLLWDHLYSLIPKEFKPMVDKNMRQWNRLDRVPLTYNVKNEGARFCKIIHPREFTWKDFSWSSLRPLDPSKVEVVKVEAPRIVKPKTIYLAKERRWVWEVVKKGLPDGRKRFLFMVLIPYLAVTKGMSEEKILEVCKEFLDNSCKNLGKCSKIYDSWIRSVIKSARERGFKGFGLEKFKERNPDIKDIVERMLGT